MTLTGKFEKVQDEDFKSCMDLFGVPKEKLEKLKGAKCFIEIVEKDGCFEITETSGDEKTVNKLKPGKEGDITLPAENIVKATPTLEDNKLCIKVKDAMQICIEPNDDGIVIIVTKGDKVCKVKCKRVSEKAE